MTAPDAAIALLVHPATPWITCTTAALFLGWCAWQAVRG